MLPRQDMAADALSALRNAGVRYIHNGFIVDVKNGDIVIHQTGHSL